MFAASGSFVLGLALVLATGCSSLETTANWDPEADLAGYRTFDFTQGMPFETQQIEDLFREMVSVNLLGKGIHQAKDDDKADFHVFLFPRLQFAGRVDWYTVGYNPWWGAWGGGLMIGARYSDIPVGGLLLDLVDAETDRLVWRSTANTVLKEDPIRNAHIVMKAIDKMLSGFPPAAAQ